MLTTLLLSILIHCGLIQQLNSTITRLYQLVEFSTDSWHKAQKTLRLLRPRLSFTSVEILTKALWKSPVY